MKKEKKKPTKKTLWGLSNKLNSTDETRSLQEESVHQRWGGNASATRTCILPQSLLDPRQCLTHLPLWPSRDAGIPGWAAIDTEQDSSAPLQSAEPSHQVAPIAILLLPAQPRRPHWIFQLLRFCPDSSLVSPRSTPSWALSQSIWAA